MQNVTTQKIEDAVQAVLKKNKGTFNVAEVIEFLSVEDKEGKIADRIIGSLQVDERFFYDEEDNFFAKNKFFNGKSFVLTPTDREIDDKILIPGHRFVPFVDGEVFPSEVEFVNKLDSSKVQMKVLRDSIQELFPYHILMGAEQISDFLIAESKENKNLREMKVDRDKIVINVYDMQSFYQQVKFKSGDALLCKICDYDRGVIEFQYLPAKDRKEKNIAKFVENYTLAMENVIDRFDNYLELHEQLSWGFFSTRAGELFGKNGASLDEFLKMADDLEITFEEGCAMFAKKKSYDEFEHHHHHGKNCDCGEDHDHDDENNSYSNLPDGVGISRGAIGSIEDILLEIGSTLSLAEIDSYMLDACSVNNHEFHEVFARMFNKEHLNYADEAQEMVFLNYLEDRFETLISTYDPIADKEKMSLRSLILEITDNRNDFFEYLKTVDVEESQEVEAELKKIAEASLHLSNILQLLNNPGYDLGEDEAEKMESAIEDLENIIQDAVERIKL